MRKNLLQSIAVGMVRGGGGSEWQGGAAVDVEQECASGGAPRRISVVLISPDAVGG